MGSLAFLFNSKDDLKSTSSVNSTTCADGVVATVAELMIALMSFSNGGVDVIGVSDDVYH